MQKRQQMESERIRKQEEIKKKLEESMQRLEEIEEQKKLLLKESSRAVKEKRSKKNIFYVFSHDKELNSEIRMTGYIIHLLCENL